MYGKITKAAVDRLREGEFLSDVEVRGFVVRRLKSGSATYGLRYRVPGGQQRWLALGLHGDITPATARRLAKKGIGDVADRRDPARERREEHAKAREAASSTVSGLLDSFLERYVRKNNLRRAAEVERTFVKYVRPRIGNKSIYQIRRSDVVAMLDAIEDENGPVMADRVLAYTRKAFNWQASRDDAFVPPIARGMGRTKPAERARQRMLDDDEIRDLWNALEAANAPACYPAFIRALLLTAQRRDEVARMSWKEIKDDSWIIPSERYKTGIENVVPLTGAVLQLLGERRKAGFVFTSRGGKLPFSGFSKAKAALDDAIAQLRKEARRPAMSPWTVHDLRRTARSLMSRAGVSTDIAERVLGHKIGGVRSVYDRHAYAAEKRDALESLSTLVAQILAPRSIAVGEPSENQRYRLEQMR
jgi:integrase